MLTAPLVTGAIAGILIHLISCFFALKPTTLYWCIEAGFCGAAFVMGFHLIYCIYDPSSLVEFHTENGEVVHGLKVTISEWHGFDIFIGGFAAIYLGVTGHYGTCMRVANQPD